jgi:hypothetical protein
MIFRNFDCAKKYYDYSSKTEFENSTNPEICGWYKNHDDQFSALFVENSKLYFEFAGNLFYILDSTNVDINQISEENNEFYIIENLEVVLKYRFKENSSNLNVAPFEYLDDEDFNWLEFVRNIINDKIRKNTFITNMTKLSS